jgi:2-iminobutanoate/2-iminopropanoate deaminase
MTLIRINPPSAALLQLGGRTAPYSNGVLVRGAPDLLFVSGQVAFDEEGNVRGDDIESQADLTLRNLLGVLEAAGSAPEHIVKLTAFLAHREYVGAYVAARERLLPSCRPASTTVIAELVRPEMLIEVEAVAVVPQSTG